MIIDTHTHFVPEHLPSMMDRFGGDRWPKTQCVCGHPDQKHVMISGKNFRTITNQCWSPQRRLMDMDEENVGIQVLSPMPELLSYWFHPKDTLDFSRYVNHQLLEFIEFNPTRFYGLGMLPLQDPELAAKELPRLKKDFGLHGVEVGTNINGKSIGDPYFAPFFEEAEALGLSIFIHALHPGGKERWIGSSSLSALIGFPTENALAIASLITGGILERYPNLKIFVSHGGGSFLSILPRLEHGWNTLEEVRKLCPQPPSYYARKLYYDSLVYDANTFQHLLDCVGSTQIMVGSDYPFSIREAFPGHWIEPLDLSREDKDRLQYKNALRFLNIPKLEGVYGKLYP